MLAGFVDGRGRKYDLNFRTLRIRLVDDEGDVALAEGEVPTSSASCEAEASVRLGPKSVPFLLRCPGELTATSRRFVFVVAREAQRPAGQVSLLNVKLPLHPDAIESFFHDQGGREYLEFSAADIVTAKDVRGGIELEVRGPAPGRPEEGATYIATFSPAGAVREAFEDVL